MARRRCRAEEPTVNIWKLSTIAFATLFVATLATRETRTVDAAPQPQMKSALGALKKAKTHLQRATEDKGGHRVKAIGLVNSAIAEVEAGIAFDNKH
jgi:hypothetical protein